MMLRCLVLALLLPLAACGETQRNLDAELDADFATGKVRVTCRYSSSGRCFALFMTIDGQVKGEAFAGSNVKVEGIGDGSRYCVDVRQPDPARCHPKPLGPGKQIVHVEQVRH